MKKVNIQYIWIERYKCLKNAEFNFSEKYHIHYNQQENKLECSVNEDYIDNFFGENMDVTAVVGSNGAGKTTLLEMIAAVQNRTISGSFVIAYSVLVDGKECVRIFCGTPGVPEIEGNEEIFKLGMNPSNVYPLRAKKLIYMSNVLDAGKAGVDRGFSIDLSTTALLSNTDLLASFYQPADISAYNYSDVVRFHIAELNLHFDFIQGCKDAENTVFHFPRQLVIVPAEYQEIETLLMNSITQSAYIDASFDEETQQTVPNEIIGIPDVFLLGKEYYEEQCLTYNIFMNFLESAYNWILDDAADPGEQLEQFHNILDAAASEISSAEKHLSVQEIMRMLLKRMKTTVFEKYAQSAYDFIRKFDEEWQHIPYLTRFSSGKGYTWNICPESKAAFKEFLSLYYQTRGKIDYLDLHWGLSSGEMAMFSLFSRLYAHERIGAASKRQPSRNASELNRDNVILLIDEADMLFHPEWQQKYMQKLLKFLPTVFPDVHIQIIVATHSPIMLSDIPKQNVIYLKRDEQTGNTVVEKKEDHAETFGANIFRLFNDAFFLKEGAIGAFASSEIEKLIALIQNYPDEHENKPDEAKKKEIQKRINIIGDAFLKEMIQKEFEKKLNTSYRIQMLEEKMQRLQAELDVLRRAEGEERNDPDQ